LIIRNGHKQSTHRTSSLKGEKRDKSNKIEKTENTEQKERSESFSKNGVEVVLGTLCVVCAVRVCALN
jgi:hypothetical protein